MGIVRWVNRIEPARYEQVCAILTGKDVRNIDDVKQILTVLETPVDEEYLEQLEYWFDEDSSESQSHILFSILERAIIEESWELDKALDSGLDTVFRVLPGMSSLVKLVDFKGIDVPEPGFLEPEVDLVMAIWSSQALTDLLPPIHHYATQEVLAGLTEPQYQKAVQVFRSDYYWGHWLSLRDAVLTTSGQHHYLGMGISV
ncbi:MAG TPA: hypothetical protein PLS70_24155 [Acidobacteriota bacterium]|nr:hypothetical protein [Acidobacteriota bacterium]